MPITVVSTLQTMWDCRWSRPGFRRVGVDDDLQREKPWVCVRTGDRRGITEEECADCPYWEELPVRS